ncbi:hypothetical protein [Polaromonas sp.]|uniref:hypothetical protein n=1 Tax=Polaromonas sp. TaxID=1869339 RepID=UPI0032633A1F
MKAIIQIDIAATHLRATLIPSAPSWAHRLVRALAFRSRDPSAGTRVAGTDHAPQPRPDKQAPTLEEWVDFPARDANEDPIAAIVEAAAQALQALRARAPDTLDGCRVNVRIGMTLATVSVVPLDASAESAQSDRQLQLIAQGVIREALGADARVQQVRCKVQADSEHLCVIALEASLITGLQVLCTSQHLRFSSCQPALIKPLDRELAASARSRDSRTLVWTELGASGERQAQVTFLRIVRGSAVNAWRTVVPALRGDTAGDQLLKASTNRFLIATEAGQDEQVVFSAWPELSPESLPVATQELRA